LGDVEQKVEGERRKIGSFVVLCCKGDWVGALWLCWLQ